MTCSSLPAQQTVQALLPRVLDSFQARGFSCRQPLPCQGASAGCVQLLCVRLSEKARLEKICLSAAHGCRGCCLNAELRAGVCVEYMLNGKHCRQDVYLCIPIQGIFRLSLQDASEFVPLLRLSCESLCCAGGRLELCFDYEAAVYALCCQLVCLPCPRTPPSDCAAIFSMPLYPAYKTPPC